MKKNIIILLIILILTYILLFIKIVNHNKIVCILDTKKDLYNKKEEIEIYYKKNKMIINEEYISESNKIIDLKYDEYINKKYEVKKYKNKLKATKEKDIKDSKNIIKTLTSEGYKCK